MKNKKNKKTRTFLYFNKKNLNNRTYTEDSIDENIINDYKLKIENKTALGELLHTDKNNLVERNDFGSIALKYVSHKITKIKVFKSKIKGEIEILATPSGKILSELIDKDYVVIRPRCIGHVDENGIAKVTDIISFDAVDASNDSFINIRKRVDE